MPLGLSSSLSGTVRHYDPIITHEETFFTNGTFVVPGGPGVPPVYELAIVCVGGGGGGASTTNGGGGGYGGDLRWIRRLKVTPGESLSVIVGTGGAGGTTAGSAGTFSQVKRGSTVLLTAAGGREGANTDDGAASKPAPKAKNSTTGTSTTLGTHIGGGTGGQGGWEEKSAQGGGGGGAGGYFGNGGMGGDSDEGAFYEDYTGLKANPAPGWSGFGAAGGGGGAGQEFAGGGGGVGLFGAPVVPYPTLTSTTSHTIGTGTKAFTVSSTSGLVLGMRMRISSTANSANYMEGYLSAITATQITVAGLVATGSGTLASWNISVIDIAGSNGVRAGDGIGGNGGEPRGTRGGGGAGGDGGGLVSTGALYGGGGGGADSTVAGAAGGQGAVRFIWGWTRGFPSANTRRIPKFPAGGSNVSPNVRAFIDPAKNGTADNTFTVPPEVTKIAVLAVGGGGGAITGNNEMYFASAGGGGGGLAYGNSITVTPGEVLTVNVGVGGASVTPTRLSTNNSTFGGAGGTSSVVRGSTVLVGATGGGGGQMGWTQDSTIGGTPVVFAGGAGGSGTGTSVTASFSGGAGGSSASTVNLSDSTPDQNAGDVASNRFGGAGGGGAAGYRGNGGAGANAGPGGLAGSDAAPNSGGGGGGGSGTTDTTAGAGGGGVGINGAGATGVGGAAGRGGLGGSGGGTGFAVTNGNRSGGKYGGGAGAGADRQPTSGANVCNGGQGAVVIVWGVDNAYPTGIQTNT